MSQSINSLYLCNVIERETDYKKRDKTHINELKFLPLRLQTNELILTHKTKGL